MTGTRSWSTAEGQRLLDVVAITQRGHNQIVCACAKERQYIWTMYDDVGTAHKSGGRANRIHGCSEKRCEVKWCEREKRLQRTEVDRGRWWAVEGNRPKEEKKEMSNRIGGRFDFIVCFLLTNEDLCIWDGSMWPLVVHTWQSSHIHLLQVLGLQDTDGEFAGGGDVAQRDANVSQLLRLCANKKQGASFSGGLLENIHHLSRTTPLHMQKKMQHWLEKWQKRDVCP